MIENINNNTKRQLDFKVQLLFIQISTKLIIFHQYCKHIVELQIALGKKKTPNCLDNKGW